MAAGRVTLQNVQTAENAGKYVTEKRGKSYARENW